MNKKLLDLLEKINAKKDEVKNLANEGKLEEAKKAKDELKELQDKFDILKDLTMEQPCRRIRFLQEHQKILRQSLRRLPEQGSTYRIP